MTKYFEKKSCVDVMQFDGSRESAVRIMEFLCKRCELAVKAKYKYIIVFGIDGEEEPEFEIRDDFYRTEVKKMDWVGCDKRGKIFKIEDCLFCEQYVSIGREINEE